jgi:hypothetical protein
MEHPEKMQRFELFWINMLKLKRHPERPPYPTTYARLNSLP